MKKIAVAMFCVLFALFGTGLLFSGGSQESKESGSAEEKITLSVVWSNSGDIPGAGDWFAELAEKYNQQNPNITAEVAEHTIDQLMPAWQAAVESQSGPDVQFFWSGVWCLEDVWAGNLEDLSQYVPQSEIDHWMFMESISYDGKPWAAPWYNFALPAMVYNKDLFREAGLDPEGPPKTWDEFMAACDALESAGITGFTFGLKDAWGAEPVYAMLGPAEIDSIDEIILASTDSGAFLEGKHVEWLEKLHEMYTKGYLNEDIMSVNYIPGRDSFFDGSAGFGQIMSGRMVDMVTQMGGRDVVDFMRIPTMGSGELTGRENGQTQAFGIPVFADHKEEAADFIMFMHEPENLNRLYEITNFFPSDDRFDASILKTDIEKDYWDIYSAGTVPYFGVFTPTMVMTEGIYVAAQMVCSGNTPQEAAEHIESVAEKWRTLNPEDVEHFNTWGK
jgi:multiple sugar transport system substrate-binding protein